MAANTAKQINKEYPLPPGPYPDGLPAPDSRAWLAANRIADSFAPGFFDARTVLDTARTIEKP